MRKGKMKVQYEKGIMKKNDEVISEIQTLRVSALAIRDTEFGKACLQQGTLCCELERQITFPREEIMQVCICVCTDMGHN